MSLDGASLLLVLGLWAFYLRDSAALLHFDEVAIAGAGDRWRVTSGSGPEFAGRFLYLPNPLLPSSGWMRASWLPRDGDGDQRPVDGQAIGKRMPARASEDSADTADTADGLRAFDRRLWPLRVGSVVVGALVLVAIPWIMATTRNADTLLALLAASWLATALMLAVLLRQRRALGMTRRRLAALAAEALLCPPYAANLYRKVWQGRGFRGDPVAFAAATMPEALQRRLHASIAARLDLFAQADDDASARSARLLAARARIAGLLP